MNQDSGCMKLQRNETTLQDMVSSLSISTVHTPHLKRPKKDIPNSLRWQKVSTRSVKCSSSRANSDAGPKNHYQVLGVSVESTREEIKEAYRRLQKQHHPDIAGSKGHEYTLLLNQAYSTLMKQGFRRGVNGSTGSSTKNEGQQSSYTGIGYSSWNGPVRSQAIFVDENKCIGCRECNHHAITTQDEALGCARVKVQFGDLMENIEVAVDSCPTNCIHWVESEELPLLEFSARPQQKQGFGVFGGGWERPRDLFAAAKQLGKQLKQNENFEVYQDKGDDSEVQTASQAEAQYDAAVRLQWKQAFELWDWLKRASTKH